MSYEAAFVIRRLHPSDDGKGVLLVRRSAFGWESLIPECRIDLCDYGTIGRNAPAVERPEMNAVSSLLPDVA